MYGLMPPIGFPRAYNLNPALIRRRVLPLLLLFAATLAPASQAEANGDPASDVLLLQDVYLPYAPGIPPALGKTITDLLKTTRKAGFPLKVAIIAQPKDLGAVPQFFDKPTSYAPFLQSEIAFNSKKPLLIVMPAGYGLAALPKGTEDALEGLDPPESADGEDLGRAAVMAIVKLSEEVGRPVPAPKLPEGTGGGGDGTSPLLVFGVPVALLALGGLLAALRRRQDATAEA
jgi:LPXTG-motif cell wall-anchored protein